MIKNERKGFTLIEILIVVAIIAILASVVLVGLGPTQQAGRDARRISDLHEVQNGLELFYNTCGYYPGTISATGVCANSATTGYSQMATELITDPNLGITQVPQDPSNTAPHVYGFYTNGATATQYLLSANLENINSTVFTSYTPPSVTPYTSPSGLTAAGCTKPNYCVTL